MLLALIASTGVGLHSGETENLTSREVIELMDALGSRVRERTGRSVAIDSGDWDQCRGRGPCLDAVRARTGAADVVIVRAIAGPLSVLVSAERFYPDVDATRTASASLARRDPAARGAPLDAMVASLFPEVLSVEIAKAPIVVPPAPEPSVAPWIVLGASAAVAVVGAGFGISNQLASSRLEGEIVDPSERDDLESRVRAHGIAANVLLGAAAAGGIAALVVWLVD